MKSTTSLSFTAGFFVYFLFVSYYNHAEDIYTPLKQSILDGNIPMVIMFGLELLSILTIATSIILIIKNICKGLFLPNVTSPVSISWDALSICLY